MVGGGLPCLVVLSMAGGQGPESKALPSQSVSGQSGTTHPQDNILVALPLYC